MKFFSIYHHNVDVQLHSFLTSARRWWMVNFRPQWIYPLERTAIPTEQEAGWASVPICKILAKKKYFYATEIWTPEYPARSLVIIEKKNIEINAIIWMEYDTMSFDIKVVLSTNWHGVI